MIAPSSWPAPLPVIFDTNVLLSGIFFGGVPGRLLTAWQESRMQLVLSPDILAEDYEAAAVLSTRYPAITGLDAILALVTQTATVVDAPALSYGVSADPEDDKFLACAIAARVPTIVSGDKHLLRLNGWAGLVIVTPREIAPFPVGSIALRERIETVAAEARSEGIIQMSRVPSEPSRAISTDHRDDRETHASEEHRGQEARQERSPRVEDKRGDQETDRPYGQHAVASAAPYQKRGHSFDRGIA